MVNGKKVIISMFVIMMLIFLCVNRSYSQEKPTEEVMKNIIARITLFIPQGSRTTGEYTNIKFVEFNITNSFISNKNNRYCIEVNYILEFNRGRFGSLSQSKNVGHYSFEKKGNQWYGWEGWGPGEE